MAEDSDPIRVAREVRKNAREAREHYAEAVALVRAARQRTRQTAAANRALVADVKKGKGKAPV